MPEKADASKTFVVTIQARSTEPASARFREVVRETLATLSWGPVLSFFAPQQSALNFVREFVLFRTKNPIAFTAAVQPITRGDAENWCDYWLFANESWFVFKLAMRIGKRLSKKGKSSFDPSYALKLAMEYDLSQAEHELLKYVEKEELYTEVYDLMRGIVLHEAGHILLAHHAIFLDVLRRYGIDWPKDDTPPEKKALFSTLARISNSVFDAFINEGLRYFYEKNFSLIKAHVNKIVGEIGASAEEFSHMYELTDFVEIIKDGEVENADTLRSLVRASLRHAGADSLPEAKEVLSHLTREELLDLVERQPLEILTKLLLKEAQKVQQQSHQAPQQGHGFPAESSMGQGGSPEGQGEEQQDQDGSGQGQAEQKEGTEKEGESSSDQEQNERSDQQQSGCCSSQDETGQEVDGEIGQGGKGGAESVQSMYRSELERQKKTKIVSISLPGAGSGSGESAATIEVEIDAQGNVRDVRVAKPSERSLQKTEEAVKATARRAETVGRATQEESLPDEVREKFRGFGTIYGRQIAEIQKKQYDWKSLFRELVKTFPGEVEKKNWINPVRAFKRKGWHLPDYLPDTSRKTEYGVVYMVDASGSMSDREVAEGLSILISGVSQKIRKVILAFHADSLLKLSEEDVRKIRPALKRLKYDKKLLSREGLLAIEIDPKDPKVSDRFLELIRRMSGLIPTGGTSHVQPLRALFEPKLMRKFRPYLSGIVAFTDCYSDLDEITPDFLKREFGINCPMVIINSDKSHSYSHRYWPVVSLSGKVLKPQNSKKKARSR